MLAGEVVSEEGGEGFGVFESISLSWLCFLR